jgi:hypothetical protein
VLLPYGLKVDSHCDICRDNSRDLFPLCTRFRVAGFGVSRHGVVIHVAIRSFLECVGLIARPAVATSVNLIRWLMCSASVALDR